MNGKMLALVSVALIVGGVVGYSLKAPTVEKVQQPSTSPTPIPSNKPHEGFTLHIDAEKHFPRNEKKIAHHFCKQVQGGMFECQLYDSDEKDARLVGIETVVSTDTWKTFDQVEQKLWHYHKIEIPKVNAKFPDLSKEEAAKVMTTLEETYGKIYLLWDPSKSDLPIGQPSITVLK